MEWSLIAVGRILHEMRMLLPELDSIVALYAEPVLEWAPTEAFCERNESNCHSDAVDDRVVSGIRLRIDKSLAMCVLESTARAIIPVHSYFSEGIILPAKQTIAELGGRWAFQFSSSLFLHHVGICNYENDRKASADTIESGDWIGQQRYQPLSSKGLPPFPWKGLDSPMSKCSFILPWRQSEPWYELLRFRECVKLVVNAEGGRQVDRELIREKCRPILTVNPQDVVRFQADLTTGQLWISIGDTATSTTTATTLYSGPLTARQPMHIKDLGKWRPCVIFLATGTAIKAVPYDPERAIISKKSCFVQSRA